MPWTDFQLNDGHTIPSLAFGTWKMGNGDAPITQVDQALGVGFDHVGAYLLVVPRVHGSILNRSMRRGVDTAQAYRNEYEAGVAIRDSGLPRDQLFITTKYSGVDGKGIKQSVKESLANLGISYLDLYLIHHPRLAVPDIPTAWKEMEDIQAAGLVKSIGVSNFEVSDLKTLIASAKVKPAANQILLHPYVYARQKPILEFAKEHGIVIEAYSALIPITSQPGGPVDVPVKAIAARLGVTDDQVLLAWTKAKGAVVVTTSSKKERLLGYLNAGDLELTDADIAAIDAAGALGPPSKLASMFTTTFTKAEPEYDVRGAPRKKTSAAAVVVPLALLMIAGWVWVRAQSVCTKTYQV
ncbi:Aldo-keto reductase [Mycena chlorophos]|uniref:Aldo-keto reductase n=1 Tax=Mycena chlorophos TaxID=658473 RepID=A0A8H6W4B7_MYCCL|nr:Aldo-keto reductase [Mycena chlorophos]